MKAFAHEGDTGKRTSRQEWVWRSGGGGGIIREIYCIQCLILHPQATNSGCMKTLCEVKK